MPPFNSRSSAMSSELTRLITTSLICSFLRLRRTKLGLGDFRTVKVIGKGAFGEVRSVSLLRLKDVDASELTPSTHFDRCISVYSGPTRPED